MAISYKLCYSVDKKGYRKGEIIRESIVDLKKCSNFADEKKGTLKLVIPRSSYFPIYLVIISSFLLATIHINMYACTSLNKLCISIPFSMISVCKC